MKWTMLLDNAILFKISQKIKIHVYKHAILKMVGTTTTKKNFGNFFLFKCVQNLFL